MKLKIYYFEKKDWKIYWTFPKLPDWVYKITEAKKTRWIQANRYYWGYVLKFIVLQYKEFWYIHTVDSLHEIFKKAFVPRKRVKSDFSKNYIYIMWSTADLNTRQFKDYMDMIKAIFEFGEMEKLWLEKIDSFIIPDINNDELLYWESMIV